MASVIASAVGGSPTRVDADTVAEVKDLLGLAETMTSCVNGEPADDETLLEDEDFVSLATAVKGGVR